MRSCDGGGGLTNNAVYINQYFKDIGYRFITKNIGKPRLLEMIDLNRIIHYIKNTNGIKKNG